MDVLDFYRRFINKDTNRERQSSQGHNVEGFAQRAKHQH